MNRICRITFPFPRTESSLPPSCASCSSCLDQFYSAAPGIALAVAARYSAAVKTVKRLLHTRYRVNDLEKSVKFYREVLGLKELHRHKSPRGSELVFLKAAEGDETIELCSFPASGPVQVQTDLTHLAFEVENLEAFGKHLASCGYQYSDGPHRSSTGTHFAFVDAPEGYEIELIESKTG